MTLTAWTPFERKVRCCIHWISLVKSCWITSRSSGFTQTWGCKQTNKKSSCCLSAACIKAKLTNIFQCNFPLKLLWGQFFFNDSFCIESEMCKKKDTFFIKSSLKCTICAWTACEFWTHHLQLNMVLVSYKLISEGH